MSARLWKRSSPLPLGLALCTIREVEDEVFRESALPVGTKSADVVQATLCQIRARPRGVRQPGALEPLICRRQIYPHFIRRGSWALSDESAGEPGGIPVDRGLAMG
jgi:hypothetical protein